jgi:dihydrofolate reductase
MGRAALKSGRLIAIAAMSQNRVIGRDGKIPWHLPEDFKWFKKMTTGHVLVMGRKTFESIGKPLPNRATVVLSRGNFSYPGVWRIGELAELTRLPAELAGRELFLCGGAQVYAQGLPLCSEIYLTIVKRTVEGDAFFPAFENEFALAGQVLDGADFSIQHYRRAAG